MSLHNKTFPNETPEYREARNELLQAEIDLRRQIEKVAEMRRALPLGGKIKEDYVFEEMDKWGNVKQTKLSELFADGKNTLIIYNAMFGPEDKKPCPSCTAMLDGWEGIMPHATRRVNFVIIAKSPIGRLQKWAQTRGWKNLRIVSSFNNSYNTDYFAETAKGEQIPAQNVFVKRPEGIFHFHNAEMLYVKPDEGQDPRHNDSIDSLWNIFDYTPEGRGTDWYPELEYGK
jgi:predicted dithiol-disulfide oxidoreductase (DUF899 family)